MKKPGFAFVAVTALALAACGGRNEDQLNEADINAESTGNLDALSDEAANVAAEAQEVENQAANLDQQAQEAQNASGAETEYDENIQGM